MNTKVIYKFLSYFSILICSSLLSVAFSQKTIKKNKKTIIKKKVVKSIKSTEQKSIAPVVVNTTTAIFTKNYATLQDAQIAAVAQGKQIIVINDIVDSYTDGIQKHLYVKEPLTFMAAGKCAVINFRFGHVTDQDVYGLYVKGNKYFENIDFNIPVPPASGMASAIQTEQGEDTFNLKFYNCRFTGAWRYNLQSTAGHGTATFIRCALYARFENIQFYSQKGPKSLIMKGCTIKTDESHNIYSHSNNNNFFDSVYSLGAGKLGMDSYETDGNLPGKSTCNIFINCGSAAGATAKAWGTAVMWRLASNGVTTEVKKSSLSPYEWRGNFHVDSSYIYNGGNGAMISGDSTLIENTGGELTVYGSKNTTIRNCNLSVLRFYAAEKVKVINTKIDLLWVNKTISGTLINSPYKNVYIDGDETFKNLIIKK